MDNLRAIGVDEIACFIDFGIDEKEVLANLPHLNALKEFFQQTKENHVSSDTYAIPLTEAQKQLWIIAQLGEDRSVTYNEYLTLQLQGDLNVTAMSRALQKLVDRHEALRTKISPQGDVQEVLSSVKIDCPVVDFSSLEGDAESRMRLRNARLAEWFEEQSQKPFDLTQCPLLRLYILKLEPELHLLFLSAHHIVVDAWSIGVMLRELGALYSSECQGIICQMNPPKQFREFIEWQDQRSQTQEMQADRSYWLEKLTAPPVLNLPTDRIRPPIQTYNGSRGTIKFDAQLTNKLKLFGRQQRCTLLMTLLSVYMTLIHRLSGQDDIIIGLPTSGRSLSGSEEIVGYCTHFLPIRSELSGNPTFEEYLKQMRGVLLSAYEHQDYPFAELLNQLNLPRDNSRSPLVSVSFNLEPPAIVPEFFQLEISLFPQAVNFKDRDLHLNVIEIAGELFIECDYNTDLFDADTINRWLSHFQTLLEAVVTEPKQHLRELPLLNENQRHQLLVEWNNTETNYPCDQTIHQLFEAQVERTPDATAVIFGDRQLSYAQLNLKANQLAHYLHTLGVGPEVLVGICVERSLDMVVGLLGILKAGGAYVPLEPDYPTDRLSFMLEDSGVSVLLTQQSLIDRLPGHGARLVCLDTDWQKISQYPQRNSLTTVQGGNLAYIIYTSGSTGKPKAVAIEHHSPVALVSWAQSVFTPHELAGVLASTSICFDLSVFELFVTLSTGGTVILAQNALHLPTIAAANSVTLINTVPSAIAQLIQEKNFPKQICTVNLAGEALQNQLVQQIYQHSQVERVFNLYGPSEDTTYSTFSAIEKGTTASVTIGRAIANTQIYILDQYLQPVPIGVPGELHIGGEGLARGYLNRPELTQEKFIPNPFSTNPDSRLYKTGDLARYLPNGNIEYLGRIDNQVKIRGFRIELGEIEACLSQHSQVQTSVVIAREDNPGDKRLVAYVVPQPQKPSITELRSFLKEKLPDYMIPKAIVILESLPLTPNGKIDRRALPVPELRTGIENNLVPPRTPIEEKLVQIWAQVLRVPVVGIHDNFFELGGDSILGIQIITRAKLVGIELTVKQLFAHQTIASLAAATFTTKALEIDQGLVSGTLPLTPIQEWFFEQEFSQKHHFNQSVLLTVPSNINLERLEQVWQKLLLHHDALRLRFTFKKGIWQQIHKAPTDRIIISRFDLSTVPENELTKAIETTANQLQASLNLSENLVAVGFFWLGNDLPARLLIAIHHLVIDGVSWRILLEDLLTGYQQLETGQAIQLPAKTTSFKDWAYQLLEYAQTEELKSELSYWLRASESEIAPLPVDIAQGANTVASASTVSVSLTSQETRSLLVDVPKAYKTQINDVLLTALVLVFSQRTHSKSVLFNLEGHGREDIVEGLDLSRTVGWFTTLFPVVLKVEGGLDNIGQALKSVKEQLRAIPNKGIGYGLLRYLNVEPQISDQLQTIPTPEITFNYLGQFAQVLNTSSVIQLATESSGQTQSLQDLRPSLVEINAIITNEQLQIDWEYSSNVHHHKTIENIALEFVATLRSLIAHCLTSENAGYTPTDFPLIKLNQPELDGVLASLAFKPQLQSNWQKIEDIYPLSSMQEGMLFESLLAPNSGVYFQQAICTLTGSVDVKTFEQAWQQVVARHSIFRTAFVWESLSQPIQVVYRQVQVKVETYDWRSLSTVEQQQQLETFLDSERQQGFQLSEAPLMRLHLLQMDENTYQFVWCHHHILLDGWSLPLVFKDLLECYQAISQEESLPQLGINNYRNYIAWLQQQNKSLAAQFWQQKLTAFTSPTPLTVDKPLLMRENNSSYGEQQIQLTVSQTDAVVSFARQHQLTISNLVQATWGLLLSRYSSQTDVVFGVTVSGRPPSIMDVESIVGVFINTLPVRMQLAQETELLSLLKDLQAQQLESEQFSYSSLVEIQGLSDVPRGMSLFESIVIFGNYPVDDAVLEEHRSFSISNFDVIEQTNYPLTVVATSGKQLLLKLSYQKSRFEDSTISRMLGHFVTMLQAIVTNPQQPISSLPLLTELELQQLLVEWNNTSKNYPSDKCISDLFEEQVARTPNAVAVVFEDQQLTYQQLNCRANQLAHHLLSLGVSSDVLVGICVERSIEMVVGLLGILKAGGAYVPLDPEYPTERLRFILEDARVSVLLTQQHLVDFLPTSAAQLVCLDTQWQQISQWSQENPSTTRDSADLAYVIYTSGSTGQPKGVQISHRSVGNFLYAMKQQPGITQQDVLLGLTTIAFDIAALEIFLPLIVGAKLALARRDQAQDGRQLVDLLEKSQATMVQATPATWRLILETPYQSPNLKILCGGEALPKDLAEQLRGVSAGVWNLYGPTETTIWSSVYQLESEQSVISIGRAIANTQFYILDSHLQPVPIGVPGELHIGGAGLARGYFNRPELTQEKFIPNPFSKSRGAEEQGSRGGERLYKTGDLARYLPDGNIEYLGRIDNQVKIRGFRIELGEVEAVLSQHSDVQVCCVIVREDNPGDRRLVAYIVPPPEQTPKISQIREFLSAKLPEYMIPRAIVILESLPLTPNGKVDRRALPAPDISREFSDQYVAPRTPVEEILSLIWTQVLKVERVGIHDRFFELGGHSLLATQLISRVRNSFKVELPLRSLFAAPTIAALSQNIQQLQQQGSASAPPILPRQTDAELPLSYAQQRLWFLDQLEPNSAFYNIPGALRLEGTLQVAALEQSFIEIIHRHEALRTNFVTVDGQASQVIHTATNWRLSVVELQHLSTSEKERQSQLLTQQQALQPFDLATEPLIRATLVVLSETEYQLIVCLHHIISDGWSLGVLVEEFKALYNAYSQGQPCPLTPLPIQYADFALWQRQWLQREVLQSQLSYWREQLADAPTFLPLPTDRPRPAVQTFAGAYVEFELSRSLTQKLTQLGQSQGVTLFMTLLAAFKVLLYRYTGQTDILVGSPIANRERSEIEGLIGFFVNTLVLRTDVSGDPSFDELLPQIREMALNAYAHQDLPFEMLVEALQPERDLSHTPLFQVMFALQNAPMSDVELSGLTIGHLPIESATAKFDLTLVMENTRTGLVGGWEYNSDLFERSTIERMTGHFVTLLLAIVANPTERISQLPLLTPSEQQQLLVEWNRTEVDYARDLCIHSLFEQQVERTPDASAVIFHEQQLTYQQLNNRANSLAHYLQSLGVSSDVLVGIYAERSIEMVVGLLGILKAGGAYVPLDPEYPTERLRFMVEDAQVNVLLTQQHLVEKLPPHQAQVVLLDSDWQEISQWSQENLISGVQGHNLGYVMYTSGSTGQPKGIAMNQFALCNLILWELQNPLIHSGVKTLQFAPISFDASFQEMFSTWFAGGTLLLVEEELRREPLALLNFLTEQKVERLFLPLVGLQQLAEVAVGTQSVIHSLRSIMTGGEQLQMTPTIRQWLSQLTECSLHNFYGPSESHVVTTYSLTHSMDNWPLLPPIGRPIANTQIYILDGNLQPVPVGVPGELYIGGAGLARGYFNRPELTQEKFIPNPFSKSRGVGEQGSRGEERLYKTGDLARYLPDGNIEYLGRIDNQVKIRGFRIELGEIEAVLSQHADVQAACVIAREETPGDRRLVAYIAPQPQVTLTISQVRNFLKEKLPEYMVPSAIVILEFLPLSPNGKVDRLALPAPDISREFSDQYIAPRTPVEEILSLIWTQVLKVERVGIHDNFFELGGHSLLATQLISRVRNSFKVELPLRSLFAAPTIASLSQNIQQLQQQDSASAPPIKPRKTNAELPLSYAQQRLWFLNQLEPNSAFYNIPGALRLQGTLQVAALEQSFIEIIHRHEALRTNFMTVDGQASQVIHTAPNWRLSVVDLQHLPPTEQQITSGSLAQQQALQPFDLATEPLIRATLVVLSETEYQLIVCLHHIVSDGWSLGVLVEELKALYGAYSQGQPCPLTPLPIQYADFAVWQRQWLLGEVLQSQLSYWREQLADAPTFLPLPTDRPRPAVQTFAGAYIEFELSMELTQKLTQLGQSQGVTLFMTLLAAFKVLLYRYTGQTDILVGSPIANRERSEIEGLIGFFVNTLVLRTDVSGDPSFDELLPQIREMALNAYAHQDLPFEMLVEALQPERDLSHTPLFQVMFALQNAPMSDVELSGLTIGHLPIESATAKFDLTLVMENTRTGLVGGWEYNSDLFERSTIERMTGHFVTLLLAIVANPTERISQLPLLTPSEQQQLLVEWNRTEVDYARDLCIHSLFEQQVERTPDASAVIFHEQQLTYQQLNNRANSLAHYLQSLGVSGDVLVGIYAERSIEMVVGLLGILKAGGAYVPLDTGYPTERLHFMVEDARVNVLLTQQHLVEKLPPHQAQVVLLDSDWQEISQWSQENLISGVKGDNLGYVMYTSGSTGQPKGIAMNQFALCNLILWELQNPLIHSGVKTLQFAPISFDASFQEMFSTWFAGGTLLLVEEELRREPLALLNFLTEQKVERLFLPLVGLQQLAEVAVGTRSVIHSLRSIMTGGEQLQMTPIIRQWLSQLTECNLHNFYGPSESHVVTTFSLTHSMDNWPLLPPIGRPIANTQIYILDGNLQPVPVGVPGELYIGGAGLARGYFNRPELTQEKFIPNPFSKSRGVGEQGSRGEERLYKTGDLARYLPDGNIEYLGRIDNQVKIRGFRIELGEIEAVLSQHADVQAACVIAREETPGDRRLVAYIAPQPQVTLTISQVRNFLKEKLPEYMVPSAIVILEFLPLSPNGKVDRLALPAPDISREFSDQYIAPRTPVEEILSLIWTQVLKVERVGIHDNFFELGGHSLLATQLISRVRNSFKVELPLRSLFAAPTIASLSQNIQQLQQQDSASAPPIKPRKTNAELPLSYAQQRLWFLDQFEPQGASYNIPFALRLEGTLQVEALQQSFIEIIHRHEALRTNFITVDGQASQVIHTATNWTVSIVDLQHLPPTEQQITSGLLTQQQALQPFNLATEPLIRATLVVLSETKHLLLGCMHHIVSDGWSMGVLVAEFKALYNAYSQGQPSPLVPLPIQYADFALWQRQWLLGEVLQSQLSYWREQLASAPTFLPLPTDRPRPAVQTFAGAYIEFELSMELTQKLTQLGQSQGVTLFMTLLAAFNILLYRYTGQTDILVGSPIANRERSEIEGLIGFFVNTLVLRTDVSGDPKFDELLPQIREMALDAYAHQDLPFEMLVEALQLERNLSHTPLFQVMFALQNAPMSNVELSGLTISHLPMESATAKFDLSLVMENTHTGLVGGWEYNSDLFERSTIERMAGHFVTLLSAIVANPTERISQLPLLTPSEQQQLLVEWNRTEVDYPQDLCIHQLFEEQVKRNPDAVAVVFENQLLTYQQLNSRANQLAHYLQSLGVSGDMLVGIYMERSIEMVVGLLGILKAGGAYLPLAPEYPIERLNFMLVDARLEVLVTQQRLADRLPEHAARVVCLDTDWHFISQLSQENPLTSRQATDLAYVIYTSGSTGTPKGVPIAYRGLLNLVKWHQRAFNVTNNDKATQMAGTAFDAAIWELWPYLSAGACIYLVKSDLLTSPVNLREWLIENQITIAFVPTPVAQELLSLEWTTQSLALRCILTGGDKLHHYRSDAILFEVVNNYGPTENSVVTTSGLVMHNQKQNSPTIGRPIDNTKVYILDSHLQPVPIGVPGELHIAGVGLTVGYLNRPELTQEKFISNPFSTDPGSRLYKTGDLTRYLPNGDIEYLRRIDNQVKIRGFRIELGEIEACLSQHSQVQICVVIAREDNPQDKRLVAYIVPQPEQTLTVSQVREFLKEKLPDYMVPKAIVILESLPLTPNGKIDRRALPVPESRTGIEEDLVLPHTPIEEKLAQIWAQVLRVEVVGIHDNFFELGGDSILSIQIVTRAKLAGIELTVKQLFAHQTIAELATVAFTTKVLEIDQGLVSGALPLTPIQQWFFEQDFSQKHHFNQSFLLTVPSNFKLEILEQVWQKLLLHHDALRLRFTLEEGTWHQTHAEPTEQVAISRFDLSTVPQSELSTTIETTVNELQASLNLSENLVAVGFFWLGNDVPARLLIVIHHLVVDGVSWRILLEDLLTGYQQLETGQAIQLPAKTTSFKDWANRLLEHAQTEVLKSELRYWLNAFHGEISPLPVDIAQGANTVASARTVTVSLDEAQTLSLLQDVPKAYKTQINDVLLTALVLVLSQWNHSKSVLFNLEGHGREDIVEGVDLSRTVGWFTTIFPVVLKLEGDLNNIGQVLKSVKEQLRAIPNKGIGYGLLRYLNAEPQISAQLQTIPTAEISFNYLGQFTQVVNTSSVMQLANESSGISQSLQALRPNLLDINAIITNERLQIDWTYSSNIHQHKTIENIALEFITTLREIITHCLTPENSGYTPTDFPLINLNQLELDQLLENL
ncbi:amino acid adenylation domain-containing protein [Scytonema sp. UIC 10036]|nr:amino acid adenylation domain-containing protein [Scytonema sp. UIC 10036]